MTKAQQPTNYGALGTLVTVFFFLGIYSCRQQRFYSFL
jgi:hypothetical protein